MRVLNSYNGVVTWSSDQVKLLAQHGNHSALPSSNSWTCQQNNANNAYNVVPSSGQVNNNNKSNSYAVVLVSELNELVEQLLIAEQSCYKNKKRKMAAAKCHYNISVLYQLAYEILSGTYKPRESVCLVITSPKPREVFAAKYIDRVVHHYLAPFILNVTERVHTRNGNISHGNRPRLSAQTAAEQAQRYMEKTPNGYVLTMDIRGFFMSIPRELSYEVFEKYYNTVNIEREPDKLELLKKLLTSDPADGCVINSPKELLDLIPRHKSLRYNSGKGLPIGNFYSQLIANLFTAQWGERLRSMDGVQVAQFVDDAICVVRDKNLVAAVRRASEDVLSSLELTLHPTKFYCQPVRHGAYFCGRFVYGNRVYAGKRVVRNCEHKIQRFINGDINADEAIRLLRTLNSYTGMICHCKTFNIQRKFMLRVLDSGFNEYLYFEEKKGHLVCKLFNMYKPISVYKKNIISLYNNIKRLEYERKSSSYSRVGEYAKTLGRCRRSNNKIWLSAAG